MLVPITVLSISLLWILLVTILARTAFPNRFRKVPRLGLTIWFTALLSSVIAAAVGSFGLGAAYFYSIEEVSVGNLGQPGWLIGFAWSFVPWVLLAGFGVALALINLRLDLPVISGRRIQQDLQLAKKKLEPFRGVQVSSISLPIHYALATKDEVIVSDYTIDNLSKAELDAVLWHELGHIRGRHSLLKSIAGLVALLTKPMSISRVFRSSVEMLCEEAADNFARRNCDPRVVERVRDVMRETNPNQFPGEPTS